MGASLAAGNPFVIKPAEDASLSLLRLAEIAEGGFSRQRDQSFEALLGFFVLKTIAIKHA